MTADVPTFSEPTETYTSIAVSAFGAVEDARPRGLWRGVESSGLSDKGQMGSALHRHPNGYIQRNN